MPLRPSQRHRFAAALLVLLMIPHAGRGGEAHAPLGATAEELIAEARRMNPSLAATLLEADAARARARGAGALADPMLSFTVEDITRDTGRLLPGRYDPDAAVQKIRLTQGLPFWGKRERIQATAQAESQRAEAAGREVENEIVARVKSAYAEYHRIHLAMDLTRELLNRLRTLATLTSTRYAQGQGTLQEASSAEIEKTALESELVGLEADRRKARSRLNTLLARPPEAPLVEAPHPRPIPPPEKLELAALTAHALERHPGLHARQARMEAAGHALALADQAWYPDVTLGVGAANRTGRIADLEAMVELNLPLQPAPRESAQAEARAMAEAARAERRALETEIENRLREAVWSLEAARRMERLILDSALPQARLGFESASRAYELGKGAFSSVLGAEQQWRKTHLEHLKVEYEQQIRLAEIEQLLGGEL